MAGSGAETPIPGVLDAHSSRRDGPGLRPLPCAPFGIVGLSFRPATPPESSSDILAIRQKVRYLLKVSYLSTHSESGWGYSSMQTFPEKRLDFPELLSLRLTSPDS